MQQRVNGYQEGNAYCQGHEKEDIAAKSTDGLKTKKNV